MLLAFVLHLNWDQEVKNVYCLTILKNISLGFDCRN